MLRQRTYDNLDIAGKRALVMGLGTRNGGVGVARYLAEHGAQVTVTDLRSVPELQASIDQLAEFDIAYVLGEHRESDFEQADIVVRNPGVPHDSKWLDIARHAGARIEMEMTIFFRACPGTIIGVTGTKGKTTTATMLATVLRQCFPDTVLAGNMGRSALDSISAITPETPVVLELSSWQLEGLGDQALSPAIAVMTNISQDHLNRYASFEDYVEAKYQITRHQTDDSWFVYNADDSRVAAAVTETTAQPYPFSAVSNLSSGALVRDGTICLFDGEGQCHKVIDVESLPIPGRPGLYAALASSSVGALLGMSHKKIAEGLSRASAVPDRQELVATVDGIAYINDTTATAPAAAITALETFADAPLVLIAGGAAKGADLTEFAHRAAAQADAIVLLHGDGTAHFRSLLDHAGATQVTHPCQSMPEAIKEARRYARSGGRIVLSPGLASFGLFLDEFQRGSAFREAVYELTRSGHEG